MFHSAGAGENEFFPDSNVINWDPSGAVSVNEVDALPSNTMSPALSLGHELGHALFGTLNRWLVDIDVGGGYRNMAEWTAISMFERPAAITLGEVQRHSHTGYPYTSSCVTCR